LEALQVSLAVSDPYNQRADFRASFSASFQVTGAADTEAPTLAAFRFAPQTLDVTAVGSFYTHQSVRADVNCTDSQSGCSSITMTLQQPAGSAVTKTFTVTMSRAASPAAGTFEFTAGPTTTTFALPQAYVTGVWTVTKLEARDSFGNSRAYTGAELTGIAVNGLSLTVNQPASPTTNPIDLVSYVHTPASIDITSATQRVTFNATIAANTNTATVRVYLSSPDSRCSARSVSLNYVEAQGANSVYSATSTYSSTSLCSGNYGAAGVAIDDQYGSRSVYGSCPSGTTGGQSSNCADPRIDSTSGAVTLQASILVVVLAIFAALFA
jgi:hypothetical protein